MSTFRRRLSDLLGLTIPESEQPRSVVSRLLAAAIDRQMRLLACQCGRIHTGLIWTPAGLIRTPAGLISLSCAEEHPRAALRWETGPDPRWEHCYIAGRHVGSLVRTPCGFAALVSDRDGSPVVAPGHRHRADAEEALLRLIEEVG